MVRVFFLWHRSRRNVRCCAGYTCNVVGSVLASSLLLSIPQPRQYDLGALFARRILVLLPSSRESRNCAAKMERGMDSCFCCFLFVLSFTAASVDSNAAVVVIAVVDCFCCRNCKVNWWTSRRYAAVSAACGLLLLFDTDDDCVV